MLGEQQTAGYYGNVLEKLKEKEEFPDNLLVMSDRGNIGTLIKGIVKKEDMNGLI